MLTHACVLSGPMVSQLDECLKFKSIRGDKNDCTDQSGVSKPKTSKAKT